MNFRKTNYLEVWKIFIIIFCIWSLFPFFYAPLGLSQTNSIILNVLSVLILYWGYFTWKFVKKEKNSNIHLIWRTIALILPYIPLGMLFFDILQITTSLNKKKTVLFATIFILIYENAHLIGAIHLLMPKHKILTFVLFYLLKALPFIIIQHLINNHVCKLEEAKNWKNKITESNIRAGIIFLFTYIITFIVLAFVLKASDLCICISTLLIAFISAYIVHIVYEERSQKINNKTRKILTVILSILAIIYAIDFIDWQINKNTYIKIGNFLKSNKNITKSKEANNCGNQFLYISKNTSIKLIDEDAKILEEFKNPKIYNSAITSCNYYIKDLNSLNIPKDIPPEKAKALQDYIKHELQLVNSYNQDLKVLKECNGNKTCILNMKSELFDNPSRFGEVAMDTMFAYNRAKKRPSVKYILSGGDIILNFAKFNIKNIQKDTVGKKEPK